MQFSDIKDRLNYERLLAGLGIEVSYEHNDELWCSCPLPYDNHKNGDTNPSFSVNISDTDKIGLYSCFVCGGGNFVQLVATLKEMSYDEALAYLTNTISDIPSTEEFLAMIDRKMNETPDQNHIEIIPLDQIPIGSTSHSWFAREGFGKRTIDEFHLRYSVAYDGIVIPHLANNSCYGWQIRLLNDPKKKYVNSVGFPKKYTLFMYDRVVNNYSEVIVVEGPKSVMKLWQMGVDNAVATFGASVTQEQIDLLKYFDDVYVWFDNDNAGKAATEHVIRKLKGISNVYLVPPVKGDKGDPGDLNDPCQVRWYLSRAMRPEFRFKEV